MGSPGSCQREISRVNRELKGSLVLVREGLQESIENLWGPLVLVREGLKGSIENSRVP